MDHEFGSPLTQGTLIKRYKRFLADITLEDGSVVTAHCANTGSMKGCSDPGSRVYLSKSDNPKRKLAYSLELIQTGETWIGVNTALPNAVVAAAIRRGFIPNLTDYSGLRREVKYGEKSRIDILLEDPSKASCYVEVKNVTLAEGNRALFPDAVTARGKRHLEDMSAEVKKGSRAAMVYLVQRDDCETFSPADAIDPEYGKALRKASKVGVETYALVAPPTPQGIHALKLIPVVL
jgi:sugar fermentation stimulation protein A